jgi:glycosyltransferase involved in cell wall biosynthesis
MPDSPTVSVICNTLNRADALANLLASLRQLTYPSFEVVVVAGPCTDHTMEVLEAHRDEIKILRCPRPNLSMSRNIGICAAAGDIVAFIDDDGIPEPTWLDELVAAYRDDEVAGVGGVVRDHTGYTFQCRFNRADRFGNADSDPKVPREVESFPGAWQFPYLIGTNSSFRRDRLVEVGGFDEEFNFYLDETDVCARLVDAGWVLRQLDGAEVHHKFLPSHVRNAARVTLDYRSVLKNRVYFSFLHGREFGSTAQIMESHATWVERVEGDLRHHLGEGNISQADHGLAHESLEAGWKAGIAAGYRGRQAMIDRDRAADPPPFRRFATRAPSGRRLRVCLVNQVLPPTETSGTGRYVLDLGRQLALTGHEVHVITTSAAHATVDLEDGVWIHRIPKDNPQPPSTIHPEVPDRIWRNAGAVADEVMRLNERRRVDLVLGVMWDVETMAVLERTDIPVVTTLVTTLGITLRTRPEWRADAAFMTGFAEPVLAIERWLMERSQLVHAISKAILREAVDVAGAIVDERRVVVSPLGVQDHLGASRPDATAAPDAPPTVLFVGRFEKRKGVDLLLAALPRVLESSPDARVRLLGDHDLPGEHDLTYWDEFVSRHRDAEWFARVEAPGVVDDETLWDSYRRCEIFVAPSRFESFGLIYVEAMMAAKPVVALASGSAPEVVVDGVTGLLVDPNADAIAEAITGLLVDPDRRHRLGMAGRARFEERFTAEAMAESIEAFLQRLVGA